MAACRAPSVTPASPEPERTADPVMSPVPDPVVKEISPGRGLPPIEMGPAGRVGLIELGKPLPPALLDGDLSGRYWARLYADAQPIEGFMFEEPPVLALVAGGPYRDFGYANPGAPIPKEIRKRAVELARANKLTVSKIVITSPALRTPGKGGVGVGSRFGELAETFGDIEARQFPGLWEEPTCLVALPSKTHHRTGFFFKHCTVVADGGRTHTVIADEEPVIRVVLSVVESAAD